MEIVNKLTNNVLFCFNCLEIESHLVPLLPGDKFLSPFQSSSPLALLLLMKVCECAFARVMYSSCSKTTWELDPFYFSSNSLASWPVLAYGGWGHFSPQINRKKEIKQRRVFVKCETGWWAVWLENLTSLVFQVSHLYQTMCCSFFVLFCLLDTSIVKWDLNQFVKKWKF